MMARPNKTPKPVADNSDANEPSRRTRIVVEAGKLFGAKGYHAVSMRQIADAADVQLSLIVYHFTSKEQLYRSVFDHFHEIFEERLARLNRIADFKSPGAVREIVEAFIRPAQAVQLSEEGRIYSQLSLREASDPEQDERGIIRDYYDPMARQFISALRMALPAKPERKIAWAYFFMVSTLVMNIVDERMARLVTDDFESDHVNAKYDYLIDFIVAGISGV